MAEVPWDTALHHQAPRLFWFCGRCWPRLVGSACIPTLLPKGHRAHPTLAGACSPVPAFTWSVAELDLAVPPTPSKAPQPLPPPWGCGGLGLTQHWEPGSKVRGRGWVCSDHCRRWSRDLTLQLSGPHQPPWRWASTGPHQQLCLSCCWHCSRSPGRPQAGSWALEPSAPWCT